MNKLESKKLLTAVAKSVDFGEHLDKIVELCGGLPLVLLMVGSELETDERMLKSEEMVELLTECRLRALSREFYPKEDRIDTKSVDAAKGLVLVPLKKKNFVSYDSKTERFDIHGILRDCLSVYVCIKNIPAVRKRFCKTFAEEIKKISDMMSTTDYTEALVLFGLENPNLQKLLTEVMYTKHDTYDFFIEVASTCSTLLKNLMASESEKFYEGCLKITQQYGRHRDEAVVKIFYGSLLTYTKPFEKFHGDCSEVRTGQDKSMLANSYLPWHRSYFHRRELGEWNNSKKFNMEEVKRKLFVGARDGRIWETRTLLSNWSNSTVIGEVLNHRSSESGNTVSPLLVAIINGHEDIVRVLLNIPEVNIELGGNILVENHPFENVRPLWCAVLFDRFSIMQLLVERGADIEGATESKSTPLRRACYDGNLKMVRYLVGQGANINSSNYWGHTCLMIAVYNGHVETLKYLLENGADIDSRDTFGRTAFHDAAQMGHVDVLKVLLASGTTAKDVEDNLSFTPIMKAAEHAQSEVVEFLISETLYSREENILALELLGSRLSIPDKNDLLSALQYYRKAMDLRYNNGKDTISKKDIGLIAAYDNHRECKTKSDLDLIKENEFLLHMEALIIRERILGPTHEEFIDQLRYMAAWYADEMRHSVSLSLLKHLVSSNQIENKRADETLELLVEFTTDMFNSGSALAFRDVVDSLQLLAYEFKESKERQDNEIMERNINTCLHCIGVCLQIEKEDQHVKCLRAILKQIVHLDPRLKDGSSLLHVAVSSTDSEDFLSKTEIITFPNASICTVLIQCGADVNCMDYKKNTPLHKICDLHHSHVDVQTQRVIIKALFQAGVHIDVTNSNGLTAIEIAQSCTAKAMLMTKIPALQCISSKTIIMNRIPYKRIVPISLQKIIELHC
ncbi:hypothetical protein CHS0354_013869 [Potamilus streckersoni]|uniref:Protein fem-1 homolog B n=1 Tax=Potamilus streckersoni TaxID=2493646 RepID=A0AAE0TB01_9BIVA|nr:hypothetical protein CHS0354_013869 [Potamilus streckersoni]